MLVMASAMSLTAVLLSALTRRAVVGRISRIGRGPRRGGRFGVTSEETTFQFTDLPLKVLKLFLQLGFALDGPLMLRAPVVGLEAQFDDLEPQPTQQWERQKKEGSQ
jgi:hypothetical protein